MSKLQLKTKLDYDNGVGIVPEGTIRIGASSIGSFLNYNSQWWRQTMLDEGQFRGNSASVTGTLVHFVCEQFSNNGIITEDDKREISNYLLKHTDPAYEDYCEDVDLAYCESQYKPMAEAIVNEYLISNPITHSEPFVADDVIPGIMVGGSIDGLSLNNPKYKNDSGRFEDLISCDSGTIVDFKTKHSFHTSLPKPEADMNEGYRCQLLTYAYILRKRGIMVDRIRLVYVSKEELNRYGKPNAKGIAKKLTDYPSKVSVQTRVITDSDMDEIERLINLIANSIQYWIDHPEARDILSHNY